MVLNYSGQERQRSREQNCKKTLPEKVTEHQNGKQNSRQMDALIH